MTTKTLIIAAALALAAAAPVYSAEKEARKKGAEGRPGLQGLRGNLEELNLTAEQKSKLDAFQEEQREKMQGLRDAAPEERREKFQKLQEATTAKMKEVLTAEQFAKWEKSRAAAPSGAPGLAGGRERMQKVLGELNLNDEQKEKVQSAMREQGEKMQELRNVPPEERREKGQKMQEAMTAKMKEILNKEQFEKWEKVRGEIGGRLGGRPGGPGGPATPSDAPAKRPEQK
ncbi:MAG TPA: hypothetical protein VI454_07620 [Verrucomicrobiae bacterium]|jgi:Spy/CpxP family protein refolding chaperone